MTIILGKCGCACAPISKTISSRTHVLEVTPLKTKVYFCKQTLSNIYLTFIRITLEYACEVWDRCFEREIAKLVKDFVKQNIQ